MLRVKGTVKPRTLIIAAAIENASQELRLDKDMLITSGNDSKHMDGSKHYIYEALDFRTKHLTADEKRLLVSTMTRRLGPEYQVILEDEGGINEHGHCEWDPK